MRINIQHIAIAKTLGLKNIVFAILVLSSLLYPMKTSAASASSHMTSTINSTTSLVGDTACNPNATFFGLPVWYKYLAATPESSTDGGSGCDFSSIFETQTPTGTKFSFENIVLVGLAILDMLLILAGIVAIVFVIFGGIQYMLSQGEPERTKGAQSTILNALIGLVIAIAASALINFIGNSFGH
jgi:hypothetical protein